MNQVFTILLFSTIFFWQACEKHPKLPKEMPDDLKIVLAERNSETLKNQFISLDSEFLIIQTGTGWHNRQKQTTKISRQDLEKIYQILLDNELDQMKNDSTDTANSKIDNSISIYSNKINLTVYQGILPLSAKNNEHFETIRLAILDFADKHKE